MNVGKEPLINKDSGLLSTVLFKLGDKKEDTYYALEGAVETGG